MTIPTEYAGQPPGPVLRRHATNHWQRKIIYYLMHCFLFLLSAGPYLAILYDALPTHHSTLLLTSCGRICIPRKPLFVQIFHGILYSSDCPTY
jgi:hypothetical protein